MLSVIRKQSSYSYTKTTLYYFVSYGSMLIRFVIRQNEKKRGNEIKNGKIKRNSKEGRERGGVNRE